MNEKDFAVFVKLRNLRKDISDKEGIPAYALFTNEQLAIMVQKRITTFSSLNALQGVGKAKLDKYGNYFLDLLRREFGGGMQQPRLDSANETIRN